MTKCMLMMDMPTDCLECPCSSVDMNDGGITCDLKNDPMLKCSADSLPSWCPLTPVNMQQMDAIIKAIQDPVYTRR